MCQHNRIINPIFRQRFVDACIHVAANVYDAEIGAMVHPTRVVGIALNTYDLDEAAARAACEDATRETGLPATDPVRFDSAPLVDAIVEARERRMALR